MNTEQQQSPVTTCLIRVQGLSKSYVRHRFARGEAHVNALHAVDLEVRKGSTLALIGESGSGKSTLARCMAFLETPDSGEIWYKGERVTVPPGKVPLHLRREIQLIFQDPASALNPRFSIEEIVEEPLLIQNVADRYECRRSALKLISQVELPLSLCHRFPHELSGGQRQRLAIARALALEPEFLILDEALAGLDLSIQAQIVNMLLDLQAARSLTYLYITHDLSLAAHIADEIAVIHRGEIVEKARTDELFTDARHASTRALLESMSSVSAI